MHEEDNQRFVARAMEKIGGSYIAGFIFRSDASRLKKFFEGDA
jgi:hypothetical protein